MAVAAGSGETAREPVRVAPWANTAAAVTSAGVAWVYWLAAPVVATVIASLWSWLRARPAPIPDTAEAMQAHSDYLAALANGARWSGADAVGNKAVGNKPGD